MLFGMVLEGLPAAVVLVPVVFPIAKEIGIHPVHFNIVLTAAVGIGLFLPPIGVGLLMALRFANISVGRALPGVLAVPGGAGDRAAAPDPVPGDHALPAAPRRRDPLMGSEGGCAPLPTPPPRNSCAGEAGARTRSINPSASEKSRARTLAPGGGEGRVRGGLRLERRGSDDAARAQPGDRVGAVAELAEDLVGVLAERRRAMAEAPRRLGQVDRASARAAPGAAGRDSRVS